MTDSEAALATLSKIAIKSKDIEGQVLWLRDSIWSDALGESLEAEEIAFYAEGLLDEGFGLDWAVIAGPFGTHVRLCFWQGPTPSLPPLEDGSTVLQTGRVPSTSA